MIALLNIDLGNPNEMNTGDNQAILTNDDDDTGQSPSVSFSQGSSCWNKKSSTTQLLICGIPLAIFFVTSVVLAVLLALGFNPLGSTISSSTCSTSGCVSAAGAILASMNLSANPCENFYEYACGGFELQQSIPAGQNKLTQFAKIDNIIQKELRALLEAPAPSGESRPRQMARRYYHSCMDTDAIKKSGVASMQKMIEKMGGLYLLPTDKVPADWSLNGMLSRRNEFSLSGFFHSAVGPDDMNVLTNIIQLDQGGLGLGSDTRDYYVNKNITDDPVLIAYADMLETFAETIIGKDKVTRDVILDVIRFEQQLALVQQSKAEQRDISVVYHKVNVSWLQDNAGFMDWRKYFTDLFGPVGIAVDDNEPAILYSVPYFRNLTKVLSQYKDEKGKRTLQNYILFQAVVEYAPKFGDTFKKAFDLFMAVFVGKRGSQETWQICVSDTDSNVGYPLGEMYADKYFTADDRERANFVMSEIVASFRQRILQVPWMDSETRQRALEKCDALYFDVGYPKWLYNQTYMEDRYANLTVTNDYTANQFTSFVYSNHRSLSQLRQSPDKTRWLMTPQTVNAYYEPTQNKFVVPAGILNIPFFFASSGVPISLNFGAIGSVAGHEISHAYDDIGRQYDKYGNLNNWWTQATIKEFENHTQCLIDQYSSYQVNGLHLRGDQTLGENIADNGGVKTSYQAFRNAVANGHAGSASQLVGIDLNADQLFFVGYAQVWCSVFTPEAMEYQIRQNEHSPGPFRVLGPLSNSNEFAAAFKCPARSAMNPDKKCAVW